MLRHQLPFDFFTFSGIPAWEVLAKDLLKRSLRFFQVVPRLVSCPLCLVPLAEIAALDTEAFLVFLFRWFCTSVVTCREVLFGVVPLSPINTSFAPSAVAAMLGPVCTF